MNEWCLCYEGYDPAQEGLREALCTLGNGRFAVRGASPFVRADGVHYPGTYLAGTYNRLESAVEGQTVENESLVNLPNWLRLTLRLPEQDWLDLNAVELLAYRQELDLFAGMLRRHIRLRDSCGRVTRIDERRLVHMGYPYLAATELTVTAEDWTGPVELESALDGDVVNAGVDRYRGLDNRHVRTRAARVTSEGLLYLKTETMQSERRVAEAARTRVFRDVKRIEPHRETFVTENGVGERFVLSLAREAPVRLEKVVALHASTDTAIAECGLAARGTASQAGGFGELEASHRRAWQELWRDFDIGVEQPDDGAAARTRIVLRLHLFHLLQTASFHTIDLDAGVPARGLHGEAYRGHVFWDELFVLPLFNLRAPEISRAVLLYRYRRLGAARAAARTAGFAGAMFPWQSSSDGREESQRIHFNPRSGRWIPDHSRLQRHVNAAIAFNIWQYYEASGDLQFLAAYGMEMLLEIARFFSSLTEYDGDRGRFIIRGVMGPDEYHEAYPDADAPGLDNNAYTNVMAVWVLRCVLEARPLLPRQWCDALEERLGIDSAELVRWEEITRRMFVPFHDDGIISQFEGYERLEEFDWDGYRERYGDIQRLDRILEAEGDTPNRYKASKQADVLMLMYLFSAEELTGLFRRLGYSVDRGAIPRNIDYYNARTSHGSTLSRVVHSWVLARLDRARSWELFTEALESDVADVQGGTTREGIHLGAMAGTVDLVQRCYTGMDVRGDILWFNPALPREIEALRLRVRYRGWPLDVRVNHDRLTITSTDSGPEPLHIGVRGDVHVVKARQTREFLI